MSRSLSMLIAVIGAIELHSGSADPSAGAGVVAPIGSFYYRTDGTQWIKTGAGNTQWTLPQDVVSSPGWFGTGIDGPATITGGTTTLGRDMFYTDLTVDATGVIACAGYRITVSGTLTIVAGGIIHRNGNNAVGATAGAAVGSVTLGAGTVGGNGGTAAGSNGGAASAQPRPLPLTGATSGAGGAGGLGPSGAGGTAGAVSNAAASIGGPWAMPYAAAQNYPQAATSNWIGGTGGGGGGGGGGGAAGVGGGGGGAAGCVSICANIIVNEGSIQTIGGNGAAGTGTNAGGGGGGGGGKVGLCYRSYSGAGTISVAGGTGGGQTGTGVIGSNGSTGYSFSLPV